MTKPREAYIKRSVSNEQAIYLLTILKLATLKYRLDHYPYHDLSYEASFEECQKFIEDCEKELCEEPKDV